MYQEYLYLIGKLKDVYKLDLDVAHKDIHTFYKGKKPLFKVMFGTFTKDSDASIVISFHIDLFHAEAIQWFINIYNIQPTVQLHDDYIEDANGETYLGEDALAIKDVYLSQDVLKEWLDNHDKQEIKDFAESKVLGRSPDHKKAFDSQNERSEAIIEFERIRKANDDDQIH